MISRPRNDDFGSSLLPDLTPLLDVIFIVMVFLMLTANVAPQVLKVDLPKDSSASTETLTDPKTIGVNLLQGEKGWAIDGQTFDSWEAFSTTLKQQVAAVPNQPLMIAGDRSVPMERLVQLMIFLQNNNITAARIQMEDAP